MTLDLVSRGRTVLAVTHRLAAAVSSDRILVMHEGRLVEQGKHDELVQRDGEYAALWSRWYGAENQQIDAVV